jgi:putative DNA primase/helicase
MTSLGEVGIRLRNEAPGEHRAPCLQCAQAKPRRSDDGLAVKIEPDGGATWICHRCGWKGSVRAEEAPAVKFRRPPTFSVVKPEPDPKAERNRELAQQIWRQSTSIPSGGIARAYLVERRRIFDWDPDRLRWHPKCPWGAETAGCIIAPVNATVGGLVVGVWRIRPVLHGQVERRGLGAMAGNCSRLIQADGPTLAVTEGVEDALAYHELTGIPAWAALCAGNMAGLEPPERFTEIVVVADSDRVGLENAGELARRMKLQGREVLLLTTPDHKDCNELLQARRASA